MSTSLIIEKEIVFEADQETVWKLLTDPQMTKQYMFGCEVISDWKVGSPVLWNGLTEDGKEITYVKGEVIEVDLGNSVTFSMLDPNMGIPDIPENYVNLKYELKAQEGKTIVVLRQGDFSGAERGVSRYEDSNKGWDMVIELMKKVLASTNSSL